jgi:hypothetical protein
MSDEVDWGERENLVEKLDAFMNEHGSEYGTDENIPPERRLHRRPDINAFLLLDRLSPGDRDMVSAGEHDEIFLDVEPHELMKVASEEDLLDLMRCGVFYDSEANSLVMLV